MRENRTSQTRLNSVPPTCKPSDLRPGDAIAFGPVAFDRDPLGWAIGRGVSAATWPWNLKFSVCHFAVAAGYNEQLAVYESTIDRGLGDCLHAGRHVKGVQVHPLDERLRLHLDVRDGQAWRLPLAKGEWQPTLLERLCRAQLGLPYDLWGAFCARSFGLGWARHLRPILKGANWKFYCNEFVLYVYLLMGWLPCGVVPSKENPKSSAKLLVNRGICGPPEEIEL